MHPAAATEHYLEAAIASAPPARLRLMLIERGAELARALAGDHDTPVDALADAGRCLRLRDILGELLGGIAPNPSPLATQVADLYVFLLQHLTRAEQDGDRLKFAQIADVLEIERQTWTEVCAATGPRAAGSDGRPPHPPAAPAGSHGGTTAGLSLNLQA